MAYLSDPAKKSLKTLLPVLLPLIIVGLACSRFLPPAAVNLFEGTNAEQAAAKIKEKIGRENIRVSRIEIRQNEMKIVVQDAEKPKNLDEYTFEKGSVSGPKPVETFSLGNAEFTADKMPLTDLNTVGFAAVPETIRQALSLADLEGGQVELISMDHQNAEMTNPQLKENKTKEKEELKAEIKKKSDECFNKPNFPKQCLGELFELQKKEREMTFQKRVREWDLAWRIFVQGTRGRKDFWADKQGKIIENPFK